LTEVKVEIAKKADKIVREEVEKSGLEGNLWQYFAVLTDTKATGVKGDSRAYGYVVAVRVVESQEAMTATFSRIPFSVLERISTRITNQNAMFDHALIVASRNRFIAAMSDNSLRLRQLRNNESFDSRWRFSYKTKAT
jgi:GMP synthase (glutamine-hydrolysing)